MVKKGSWVQIHSVVLTTNERAPQVPESTKNVPLEMLVKGFLTAEAQLGEEVEIKTITGRVEKGKLVQVEPAFTHSFGKFIPEILEIDQMLQKELYGREA